MISNIKQKERAKPDEAVYFNLAEAYSEPFPTPKQGGYLTGGNYFHKNIHVRCLTRF